MTLHKSFPIALLALLAFLIFLGCVFLTFIVFLIVSDLSPRDGLARAAQPTSTAAATFSVPASIPTGSAMFSNRVTIGRGYVRDVAWGGDGNTIAVTGHTGTWLYTPTLRDVGYLPEARLSSFSPNGTWLAGIDQENKITVWETASWKRLMAMVGHQEPIILIRWSPDSRQLASVDRGGRILIWDITTHQAIASIEQMLPEKPLLQWSPDATQLAAVSSSNTIWVWNANTGAVAAQLPFEGTFHTAYLLWGPDGKTLFRSSLYGEFSDGLTLTKLDLGTGNVLFEMSFRAASGVLVLSPDRTRLAVVGQNIALVEVATGRLLKTLVAHSPQEHLAFLTQASWSPDGRKIAGGDTDWVRSRTRGMIYVWDVETGNQLGKLDTGGQGIVNLMWHTLGNTLLSFDQGNTVQTWDMTAMRLLSSLDEHHFVGGLVTWNTDWNKVAATDGGSVARVWNTATGQQVATLSGHFKPITAMAWKPGDTSILVTSSGESYSERGSPEVPRLWDTAKGILLEMVRGPNWGYDLGEVSSVVWSPDGSRLFMANYAGRLMVWNAASKALERNVEKYQGSNARNAQLTPDGQKVTVYLGWSGGACLSIWNWKEGAKDAECVSSGGFRGCGGGGNSQYAEAWTPDGKRFQTASWSNNGPNTSLVPLEDYHLTVNLHTAYDETVSREKLTSPAFALKHTTPIKLVSWSTDRQFFLSFSDDNLIQIWSAATGELLTKLSAGSIRKIAWNPKDDSFITIDERGNALLWQSLSGVEGFAWESTILASQVDAAVWHPDGQTIVLTSTRDNTLRLLDPRGKLLDRFIGVGGDPVWSPDGRRLSQTNEGMIVVWTYQGK